MKGLTEMSEDERITNIILERLKSIEAKIDGIQSSGCSRAETHARMQANEAEIFQRLNALERSQAEGRGKLAVAAALCSAAFSLFAIWLGKRIG